MMDVPRKRCCPASEAAICKRVCSLLCTDRSTVECCSTADPVCCASAQPSHSGSDNNDNNSTDELNSDPSSSSEVNMLEVEGRRPQTCISCPASSKSEELTHVDASNKPIDIWDLPVSILLRIFSYLTLDEREMRAALVCSSWLRLSRDPSLWRSIILKGRKTLTDDVLTRITGYSSNVLVLNIGDCEQVTDKGFTAAVMACPSLHSLKLTRCSQLRSFGVIGDCVRDKLRQLDLSSCLRLTDEALIKIAGACRQLTHLTLLQCSITDVAVQFVARGCTRLQMLSLAECLKLTNACLHDVTTYCTQLETFNCRECNFDAAGIKLCAQLHNLRSLDVSNIKSVNDRTVMEIVDGCRLLTCLNLSLCSLVTDSSVSYIACRARHITSLFLVSCDITNHALMSLASHCKTLEVLDVGYTKIEDESVVSLSASCPHLRSLGLIRCDKVMSDTITTLIARHPHIEYSTVWLELRRLLLRAQAEGYQLPNAPFLLDQV